MTDIKINMLRLFLPLGLLIFLAFIGTGSGETMENKIDTFILSILSKNTESQITVKASKEFAIKIESNITTGFSWTPKKIKDNSPVKFLRVKDDEETEEASEQAGVPPKFGEPSYETLLFKALKPGKVELILEYRRPWEKNTAPNKIHKVIVTVLE